MSSSTNLSRALHLEVDRARHDVARRELAQRW
jgi:hypothetical protein